MSTLSWRGRALRAYQSSSWRHTVARRCSKDPRPRAWQSPNFRHWKRPSNGTRAPRIRQRHSIDLKARSIAASLLKALKYEGRAASTYFCKLGKEAKCGIRAPQINMTELPDD